MKQYVYLFAFMALALSACEGPMGPAGEPGEGLGMEVHEFTVVSRDWESLGEAGGVTFYRYIMDLDIGSYIYKSGNVSVFMYLMDGDNEVQAPLPYSIPHADNGGWTEHYSFDFDRGTVSFYADYRRGERPPTQDFRIVLTW